MKYESLDYKEQIIDMIINKKINIIMSDFESDKELIVLTALNRLKFDYFEKGKIIVITSKYLAKEQWIKYINEYEHLKGMKYSVIIGAESTRKKALDKEADIFIINYDGVRWLINKGLWDFDIVVIGELSEYKNDKAVKYKALKGVINLTDRVIALTNEPASNGLEDLWAELYLLDDGKRLGMSKSGYYDRYFFTKRYWNGERYNYHREPKNGAKEALYKAISDICTIYELYDKCKEPICDYKKYTVEMSAKEYSKYRWLKESMCLEFEDGTKTKAYDTTSVLSKLLQMANGVIYDDNKNEHCIHKRKLDAVEEILKHINGRNVLIAYWFQHDKNSLMSRFPNAKVIDDTRDVKEWNEGKISIGLMNPAKGGPGIDMSVGGSILIWYSLTWSLKLYEQMNHRIIGKNSLSKKLIAHIVTLNTVDESIMKVLEKKEDNQQMLLDALKRQEGEVWYV